MTSFLKVVCSKNEAVDGFKYSSEEWGEKQRIKSYFLQDNLKTKNTKVK